MSDILDSGLAGLIAALRAERGFPGATAAVALADGRTLVAAAGMADPDAGAAMAPDAVMLQASVGKMYVGAIARLLADQGVLSLDAPVADYLGARPWFARLPNHAAMRLRHLLSHSAGLHDYMNVPAFAPLAALILGDPEQFCDPERLIGCILDLPPLFAPGEAFAYTDAAFLVAGLAIEAAAGEGYYDLVRRLVLEPWGLGETFAADRRRIPGLVPGFRGPNPMGLPRRSMEDGALTLHPGSEWAGGGWASSSGDMARFALRLLGGPDSRHRDAVKACAQPAAAPIGGSYGLGVLVSDSPLGERFGHGGWTPGYRTDVHCYPAHGMAVAVMVNADDPACASGDDLLAFGARVAAYAAEHPILQQGDSRDV
ncbi:serine hydrolase domain-containing protein [Sphingomonas canadensis]|uniref:Serine hydrolase domain-containing protein n=1 Tax=Sphingomonas canadensis TaxID=1219257 RepID=A0ABW3H7M6_9SPHN|nr:serine hydrolase domain-containing protein [Sphingomonas canadensis]MCW3836952.1 beta-lactamase family protein [Sphingomonas canadensis]